MTDRDALIAAIAAAPADDLPRLVFADWLEENGDAAQAAFIRGHIELARAPRGPKREKLAVELKAAAVRHAAEWVAPLCEAFGQPAPTWPPDPTGSWFNRLVHRPATAVAGHMRPRLQHVRDLVVPCTARGGEAMWDVPLTAVCYRRGMADSLSVAARHTRYGAGFVGAFRLAPAAELDLDLPPDPAAWDRIDGPWLGRVRTLALSADRPATGIWESARAVFHSPHLTGLRALGVRWWDRPILDVRALCGSPAADRLRVLRLPFQAFVFRGLREYPSGAPLEELCPDGTGGPSLTADEWRELADVPFRPALRRLSLRGCGLSEDALAALCRGPRWDSLEALRLDDGLLADAGGVAFARLAPFPRLQVLRLDHNRLGDDTARALARSRLVHTLRFLDLSHNAITADGAQPLAAACAEGPLRMLRLGGNEIPRRRRRRIRDILRDRVALDP